MRYNYDPLNTEPRLSDQQLLKQRLLMKRKGQFESIKQGVITGFTDTNVYDDYGGKSISFMYHTDYVEGPKAFVEVMFYSENPNTMGDYLENRLLDYGVIKDLNDPKVGKPFLITTLTSVGSIQVKVEDGENLIELDKFPEEIRSLVKPFLREDSLKNILNE